MIFSEKKKEEKIERLIYDNGKCKRYGESKRRRKKERNGKKGRNIKISKYGID